MREITVALAGNPNAGKTTLFNAITGSRQHVGNYAGVTVEKKEGRAERNGTRFTLIDLPGTYSLSANSPEEVVARDFLARERPDVVVHVVDASNLDRNLYLTTQLMELGGRLVVALNMTDVAEKRGLSFDLDALSRLLKAPVVPTVGNRARGAEELLDAVAAVMDAPDASRAGARPALPYPGDFAALAEEIDGALSGPDRALADAYPPRWFAERLLENDPDIAGRVGDSALRAKAGELRREFEKRHGEPPEIRATEAKFGWAAGLAAEVTRREAAEGPESRYEMSDKIDALLLHRHLGLPIFLGMMYLMFQLVFTLAETPMAWMEACFAALGEGVAGLWPEGAVSPLRDLLVEGVIGGVGGVLVFLPNILLLFLAIAFLEGTGYMARAAFIMDGFMHRIGLHGKSFIPMLLGFGCNVPAIMAARTLENRRDRLTTIMVIPFMSCGARLPIYTLLIPAFFPGALRAWMLWLIYLIGILFAVFGAKLLRATVFRGDTESFVMELPPYRMPTLRTVLLLMWDRAGEYCKKAGTVVLAASILLWAMTVYPKLDSADPAERLAYSASGRAGRLLEPVLRPVGFDWRVGTALIGSFAAKEVFVAQLGIVFSVEEEAGEEDGTLRETLRRHYTPLQAFCMMLYCLLSMPCVVTIAVTRREAGGWRYALAMMLGQTLIAYLATLAVFQAGTLLFCARLSHEYSIFASKAGLAQHKTDEKSTQSELSNTF